MCSNALSPVHPKKIDSCCSLKTSFKVSCIFGGKDDNNFILTYQSSTDPSFAMHNVPGSFSQATIKYGPIDVKLQCKILMAIGKVFENFILAFLCCFEAQLKETLQCNVHVSKVVKLSENLVFKIQTSMTSIIQCSAPMANCWPCFLP